MTGPIAAQRAREHLRAAGVPEAAADPDGAWLFQACGLRSVHRLAGSRLYVSHITTGGLHVEGPDRLAAGASLLVPASPSAARP